MNITKIPDVLKKNALWCVWKPGKIPCDPRNGNNAKTNLPETFSDFITARNAFDCSDSGKYEGLGILIYNGFCAIDIDHCVNEKGELSDIAKDIIAKMGSYTEISPSGTGIHIIFTVRNFQFDKEIYYINNQKIGLEVYISEITKKFITITGNSINDNDIADNPPALQEILDKYMQKNQSLPLKSDLLDSSSILSDREYLQIGLKKDKKLIDYWNGNRPLKSESENDMGFMAKLLYWTNGNADEAINAFRNSPYASQKDSAHQKKIQRLDYLQGLIQAAMPSKTAAQSNAEYQARQQQKRNQDISPKEPSAGLKIISAKKLQETKLPPVEYLIEDILPQGASLLTAASKIGKSWLVLDMGLKIAAGERFFNKETKQTGVLYLALEDSYTRLQDRMNKVLNDNPPPENFYFLTEAPNLENDLLAELEATLTEYPEIKLIIIDTLQKIRGQALPRESAYQQDYREMGVIKNFADRHKISTFLVHHNRKLKDEEDPYNMISGTNGIMGVLDTIFMITKKSRNDKEATLHITGRDVSQSDIVIQFNKSTCRWEVIGDKEEIDREEYESNPIVKVIKELINLNGYWKGTASELIQESKKLQILLSETAQKIGYKIKDLKELLLQYDGIHYDAVPNGNAGKYHYFYRDNIKITKIPLNEPEECDDEDYSDIEF